MEPQYINLAEYSAPKENIFKRAGKAASELEAALPTKVTKSLDYRVAKEMTNLGTYFIPFVGEARSAHDMVTAAREGKYFWAALAALGILPFMGHVRMLGNLGKSGKLFKVSKKTQTAVEKAIKTATKEAEGMEATAAAQHVQNAAAEAAIESVGKNVESISKELSNPKFQQIVSMSPETETLALAAKQGGKLNYLNYIN